MSSPEMTTAREESVDPIDFAVGCLVVTAVIFLIALTIHILRMH